MKKEKNLWLKKLKFLFGFRSSKANGVDLVKYSYLWLFKKKINRIGSLDKEALQLLLDESNNKRFETYAKHITQLSSSAVRFMLFVCENGNKEQISYASKCLPIDGGDQMSALIERLDDVSLAKLLETGKYSISSYNACKFIKSGFEKSLFVWLERYITNSKNTSSDWGKHSFEVDLCNSNLEEAKNMYFSSCSLHDFSRAYVIKTKNKKYIENIWQQKHFALGEYIELIKSNDKDLQKYAVQKAIESGCCDDAFVIELFAIENKEVLKEYLKHTVLSCDMELMLVKNASNDVIKCYVEENEKLEALSDNALRYIFDNKDEDFANFIFNTFGFPYALEKQLIESGDEEKIRAYFNICGLHLLNECLLIKKASPETILCYINSYKHLDPQPEALLFKKNDRELNLEYLKILNNTKAVLSKEALEVFILNGEIDDVISYIKKQGQNVSLHSLTKASILRGDKKLLELTSKHITSDIVGEIAKSATVEQLVMIFNNPTVVFNEFAQVELCKRKDLMLETMNFKENSSLLPISYGADLPAIAYFIKSQPLAPRAEKLLFDESVFNKELVLYYISLYPLSLELEELLFEPKYEEILTEYIKIHPMENVGKFCELI